MEAASLRGRQKRKRLRLQAGRKICLPQQTGEGVGMASQRDRTEHYIHEIRYNENITKLYMD